MRRTSNTTLLPLDAFQVRRHIGRHNINPEIRQLLLVSGRLRARRGPSARARRRSRQTRGLRRDRGGLSRVASRRIDLSVTQRRLGRPSAYILLPALLLFRELVGVPNFKTSPPGIRHSASFPDHVVYRRRPSSEETAEEFRIEDAVGDHKDVRGISG